MPYTTLVSGTTISASWANANVRDQVVTPFTNTSARDSAITSPVTGMFCYTSTDDSHWRYSGSKWLRCTKTLLKIGDQSWTNTTVKTSDDTLFFTVDANAIYAFDMKILWFASTVVWLDQAFTFPSGGRLDYDRWTQNSAGALYNDCLTNVASGTATRSGGAGSGNGSSRFAGIYANGSTAGTLQLQAAQGTSNASSSSIFRGSQVTFTQIS